MPEPLHLYKDAGKERERDSHATGEYIGKLLASTRSSFLPPSLPAPFLPLLCINTKSNQIAKICFIFYDNMT